MMIKFMSIINTYLIIFNKTRTNKLEELEESAGMSYSNDPINSSSDIDESDTDVIIDQSNVGSSRLIHNTSKDIKYDINKNIIKNSKESYDWSKKDDLSNISPDDIRVNHSTPSINQRKVYLLTEPAKKHKGHIVCRTATHVYTDERDIQCSPLVAPVIRGTKICDDDIRFQLSRKLWDENKCGLLQRKILQRAKSDIRPRITSKVKLLPPGETFSGVLDTSVSPSPPRPLRFAESPVTRPLQTVTRYMIQRAHSLPYKDILVNQCLSGLSLTRGRRYSSEEILKSPKTIEDLYKKKQVISEHGSPRHIDDIDECAKKRISIANPTELTRLYCNRRTIHHIKDKIEKYLPIKRSQSMNELNTENITVSRCQSAHELNILNYEDKDIKDTVSVTNENVTDHDVGYDTNLDILSKEETAYLQNNLCLEDGLLQLCEQVKMRLAPLERLTIRFLSRLDEPRLLKLKSVRFDGEHPPNKIVLHYVDNEFANEISSIIVEGTANLWFSECASLSDIWDAMSCLDPDAKDTVKRYEMINQLSAFENIIYKSDSLDLETAYMVVLLILLEYEPVSMTMSDQNCDMSIIEERLRSIVDYIDVGDPYEISKDHRFYSPVDPFDSETVEVEHAYVIAEAVKSDIYCKIISYPINTKSNEMIGKSIKKEKIKGLDEFEHFVKLVESAIYHHPTVDEKCLEWLVSRVPRSLENSNESLDSLLEEWWRNGDTTVSSQSNDAVNITDEEILIEGLSSILIKRIKDLTNSANSHLIESAISAYKMHGDSVELEETIELLTRNTNINCCVDARISSNTISCQREEDQTNEKKNKENNNFEHTTSVPLKSIENDKKQSINKLSEIKYNCELSQEEKQITGESYHEENLENKGQWPTQNKQNNIWAREQGSKSQWPHQQQQIYSLQPQQHQQSNNVWPQQQKSNSQWTQPQHQQSNRQLLEEQQGNSVRPEQQQSESKRPQQQQSCGVWPQEQKSSSQWSQPQKSNSQWSQQQQQQSNSAWPQQQQSNRAWPQSRSVWPQQQKGNSQWPQQQKGNSQWPQQQQSNSDWPQKQSISERPQQRQSNNHWPKEHKHSNSQRPQQKQSSSLWPQPIQQSDSQRAQQRQSSCQWPQEQQQSNSQWTQAQQQSQRPEQLQQRTQQSSHHYPIYQQDIYSQLSQSSVGEDHWPSPSRKQKPFRQPSHSESSQGHTELSHCEQLKGIEVKHVSEAHSLMPLSQHDYSQSSMPFHNQWLQDQGQRWQQRHKVSNQMSRSHHIESNQGEYMSEEHERSAAFEQLRRDLNNLPLQNNSNEDVSMKKKMQSMLRANMFIQDEEDLVESVNALRSELLLHQDEETMLALKENSKPKIALETPKREKIATKNIPIQQSPPVEQSFDLQIFIRSLSNAAMNSAAILHMDEFQICFVEVIRWIEKLTQLLIRKDIFVIAAMKVYFLTSQCDDIGTPEGDLDLLESLLLRVPLQDCEQCLNIMDESGEVSSNEEDNTYQSCYIPSAKISDETMVPCNEQTQYDNRMNAFHSLLDYQAPKK
eukprot:GHVL01019870.1.p1 GENE.GHVL01019870.1~~GHVL01019870.1.p1  ORF type:complete len:1720 (+),score=408.01 GHVL01019870.1:588-5162(+)